LNNSHNVTGQKSLDLRAGVRSALPRLGLLAACLIFFDAGVMLWGQGTTYANFPILLVGWALWLVGIGTGVAALINGDHVKRLQWLTLAAFVVLVVELFAVARLNAAPFTTARTDNEMITQYAVEALKRGENPYTWNFTDSARVFRDSGAFLTPFLDGSTQYRLIYPALPALTVWLFDLVGLGQVRVVNLVALLALGVLMFAAAPRSLRGVILLPLLAIKPFIPLPIDGTQDIVWCFLLTAMVVTWRRGGLRDVGLWRAVLLGLAGSYKQQTWFVAPFLLLLIWYTETDHRWRRMLTFAGIATGVFAAINLPFFISDPAAWIGGVFEPLYAEFNSYSQGAGALAAFGTLPLSRSFYAGLQFAWFGAALWLVWRHPRMVAYAVWVIPAVLFWLYYRGLANYWLFYIPPLLLSLFYLPIPNPPRNLRRRSVSFAVVGMFACVPLVIAARDLTAPSLLKAELRPPLVTFGGGSMVGQVELSLTNNAPTVIVPQFAVQHDPSRQALPWRVMVGPESLAPGTTARYIIGVDENGARGFPTDRAAQVVITDARSSLRTILPIPNRADRELPDRLWNPAFAYWSFGVGVPDGWWLSPPDFGQATVSTEQIDGRDALKMEIVSDSGQPETAQIARLSQTVTFTDSFALWVYPPAEDTRYGLQIADGTHKLQILFDSARTETITTSLTEATVILPAPRQQWSRHTIDVAELYQRLGWQTPPVTWRVRNDTQYPARQMTISLIAAPGDVGIQTIYFGEIALDDVAGKARALLDHITARPDEYYTGAALQYMQLRNFAQAAAAYQTALRYNPRSSAAYGGLSVIYLAQGRPAEAIRAGQAAMRYSAEDSEARRKRLIGVIQAVRIDAVP
jgi:hypothetical protein